MANGAGTAKGTANQKRGLMPPWKPGQTGNPSGSNKKQRIAAELIAILNEAGKEGAPTVRDVCLGVLEQAKDGNVQAFIATADRVDGKLTDRIDIRMPSPVMIPQNERDSVKPKRRTNGNGRKKANGKNRIAS